jgi:hypothetical protein
MTTSRRITHDPRIHGAQREVARMKLVLGLWRALLAAQDLGEHAIARNLEMLIALSTSGNAFTPNGDSYPEAAAA